MRRRSTLATETMPAPETSAETIRAALPAVLRKPVWVLTPTAPAVPQIQSLTARA